MAGNVTVKIKGPLFDGAPADVVGDHGGVAGRVRGFETFGDMLRSLAVVGVFVAVILMILVRFWDYWSTLV